MGRNIAHNLALLGAKVKLITALGADDGAKRVEASCADLGIDLTDSLYVPDGATSTYLFLADSNGDMALAMNDMAIYEQLTPTFLETKLNTLNAAALVVLDTNLSAESIRYLGEHCTAPLFADPVSAAKAGKLEPVLGRLHTLKPNRMEAELLSGVTVTDEASLYRAADTLLAALEMMTRGAILWEWNRPRGWPDMTTSVCSSVSSSRYFLMRRYCIQFWQT